MKTLRNRLVILAGAMGLAVVLAVGLLPRGGDEPGSGFPIAVLSLLVAAGGTAFWLRRRAGGTARDGGARLRVVERVRLQPGRELCLIQAEGRRLLIAAGEGGVRLLARLHAVDREPEP